MKKALILSVITVSLFSSYVSANITLYGTEHMDLNRADGDAYLHDSSSLDLLAWGTLGSAYLYNNSQLRLIEPYSNVGVIVYSYGSSRVEMSSSPCDIANLSAHNDSTINISDGNVGLSGSGGGMSANDNSTINITGGKVRGLNSFDTSTLNLYDGADIEYLYPSGYSTLNMSGGSVRTNFRADENSILNINGGAFYSGLNAYDFSKVIISGQFYSIHLDAHNAAQLIFEGTDFEIDGVPVPYGQYYASDYANGQITGTLMDGSGLSKQFSIYDDASIVLIPEPTTLLLLGFGVMIVKRKK